MSPLETSLLLVVISKHSISYFICVDWSLHWQNGLFLLTSNPDWTVLHSRGININSGGKGIPNPKVATVTGNSSWASRGVLFGTRKVDAQLLSWNLHYLSPDNYFWIDFLFTSSLRLFFFSVEMPTSCSCQDFQSSGVSFPGWYCNMPRGISTICCTFPE